MFDYVLNLISRDERGQGLAEYALILALIAVVVIAAVTLLGTQINTILTNIANAISRPLPARTGTPAGSGRRPCGLIKPR